MIFNEVQDDLFNYEGKAHLVHCVSADFALGAGIAVEFDKRYDMKRKLRERTSGSNIIKLIQKYKLKGCCILIDNVFNLVTKAHYFDKPSYDSIEISLEHMKLMCKEYDIKKIAMPRIACGLDSKDWVKVRSIILNIFRDTDIEIIVCIK